MLESGFLSAGGIARSKQPAQSKQRRDFFAASSSTATTSKCRSHTGPVQIARIVDLPADGLLGLASSRWPAGDGHCVVCAQQQAAGAFRRAAASDGVLAELVPPNLLLTTSRR